MRPTAQKRVLSDSFMYSRFNSRDASGAQKEAVARGFRGGSRMRIEPFSTRDQRAKTAAAKPGSGFKFQFDGELSGTASQVEPFSLSGSKRCVRIREGAFFHTRCF